MPLPKYRRSRSRGRSRRAANFLSQIDKPEMNKCPRCNTMKRMHFVCPACGFYAGRQVFVVRDRTKKDSES